MSVIDDLRIYTTTPFEQARAVPRSVCTDPAFLEVELSHIFAQDSFCMGRAKA